MNANKTGYVKRTLKQGREERTLCITLAMWAQVPNFAYHFCVLLMVNIKIAFPCGFWFFGFGLLKNMLLCLALLAAFGE
jgi:hypothetical protein